MVLFYAKTRFVITYQRPPAPQQSPNTLPSHVYSNATPHKPLGETRIVFVGSIEVEEAVKDWSAPESLITPCVGVGVSVGIMVRLSEFSGRDAVMDSERENETLLCGEDCGSIDVGDTNDRRLESIGSKAVLAVD